jgi:hypothetical protein
MSVAEREEVCPFSVLVPESREPPGRSRPLVIDASTSLTSSLDDVAQTIS